MTFRVFDRMNRIGMTQISLGILFILFILSKKMMGRH